MLQRGPSGGPLPGGNSPHIQALGFGHGRCSLIANVSPISSLWNCDHRSRPFWNAPLYMKSFLLLVLFRINFTFLQFPFTFKLWLLIWTYQVLLTIHILQTSNLTLYTGVCPFTHLTSWWNRIIYKKSIKKVLVSNNLYEIGSIFIKKEEKYRGLENYKKFHSSARRYILFFLFSRWGYG